jgi:hypothetical protein
MNKLKKCCGNCVWGSEIHKWGSRKGFFLCTMFSKWKTFYDRKCKEYQLRRGGDRT